MNTIGRLPASLLLVTAFLISPILFLTKPAISKSKTPSKIGLSYFVEKSVVLTTRVKQLPKVSENITSGIIARAYSTYYTVKSAPLSSQYGSIIDAAAAKYGISSTLMNSIISCESGYNPQAYNPSGASGIAQFMPSTFYSSWNIYSSGGLWNPVAQIYAMALKISQGGVNAWTCK